jgi:hypothetical protein
MGCASTTGIVALLFAIFVGVGGPRLLGFWRWADGFEGSRGKFFTGMTPALHEGKPWGFQAADIPDLAGEVAFVTGANVGLGYWTAHHLADHGATVVLGCRSKAKCDAAAAAIAEDTGSKKLSTVDLDLASFASIRACAKAVTGAHARLDSLILNAGVMVPPFTLTKEGLEMQIGE